MNAFKSGGADVTVPVNFDNVSLRPKRTGYDERVNRLHEPTSVMFLDGPANVTNRQDRDAFGMVTAAGHESLDRLEPMCTSLIGQCRQSAINSWRGDIWLIALKLL
ncbi:hypothetical protein AVO44_08435 [Ruegeria profundi]|uniref:Uncharacterized protein n=1 Tax=Ruegeria profundi TaxID=1685378 RepID=A0A0X3TU34_9RHOB|nr:hypothetical protein AVO44_08435 [Ruegeria profundi]